MLLSNLAYGFVAALSFTQATALATCSANLLIDDFDQFSQSVNALGTRASDDGSMQSLALSATGDGIVFVPSQQSYFYETVPCTRAAARGYDSIAFSIQAPRAGATFMLEIQTRAACDAAAYQSAWARVGGLTGARQTVVVPLASFGAGANTDAVTAFNWATWDTWDAQWELGSVELVCSSAGCAS